MSTTYYQGDIVLVPFPFSDQTNSKNRPAIVVSNSTVNKTSDVILAQISSEIRNDAFSFLLTENDLTDSLMTVSEVRCHKLFITDKRIIKRRISSLKTNTSHALFTKIKSMF